MPEKRHRRDLDIQGVDVYGEPFDSSDARMRASWDQFLLEKAKEEPDIDVVEKYGTGESLDVYQPGLSESLARDRLAQLLEVDAAAEAAQRIVGETPDPGDMSPLPEQAGPLPPAQPE